MRFVGEGDGLFGEAVRGLTGLRRDPGAAARQAQIAGDAVPSIAPAASKLLQYIPAFGDWTLLQPNADSFTIRKRTADGHAWLDSAGGGRASGLGYFGGPAGGIAFGIRNFWQSHPAQLDIRGAQPATRPPSRCGCGRRTRSPWTCASITTASGRTRTRSSTRAASRSPTRTTSPVSARRWAWRAPASCMLWVLPATPPRARLAELAQALRQPAVIVPTPQTTVDAGVFGHALSLPSQTPPQHAALEKQLDWMFDFYRGQQDQRRWYGFWNYGDVMHTYDFDRHEWRYDIGGYAWDNSELATDVWLWMYFLRSGRADAFRFAEAMTRHTGEVDVHHLGRFAPLGSRHNVQHWGCSAKQLRISTALNRRFYYFLTADERVGDLMREQLEAARTLRTIPPGRKLADAAADRRRSARGFRAPGIRHRLGLAGQRLAHRVGAHARSEDARSAAREHEDHRRAAARLLHAAVRASTWSPAPSTSPATTASACRIFPRRLACRRPAPSSSSCSSVPEFERAWLQYCELYNAPAGRTEGRAGRGTARHSTCSRATRASRRLRPGERKDPKLAARAWREFADGRAGYGPNQDFTSKRIEAPAVLNPVDEGPGISTNSSAQWGLAGIVCLAYARD